VDTQMCEAMQGMMGQMGGMPMMGGAMIVMLLVGLLLVAVVIAVVMLAVRSASGGGGGGGRSADAVHELELRYARGEVDRDDYLQRRADLEGR
jgi:putative membrane protein